MGIPSLLVVTCVGWLLAPFALSQVIDLDVDLGYAVYRGVHNESSGLNSWKGIRYAAPPVGALRWQRPTAPEPIEEIVLADQFGPSCPQAAPQLSRVSVFVPGDEDCLFLNVYSPEDASAEHPLPVFVSIHGGGYGLGNANYDVAGLMASNDNSFITVTIQYRLGAFGFLSSGEVKERGVLNAGLLDQNFAFQWIQEHISQFGGDPERITIAGESAGGGSVLLHSIAQDGGYGNSLFQNIIAASPWVPTQPYYDDDTPTKHYNRLAETLGCEVEEAFDCLVEADSLALQLAAHTVSSTSPTFYGNWAFVPVIDGDYVTGPPSVKLSELQGKVNGERILIGNNANEGPTLIPTIRTQEDLVDWIKGNWVNLSEANITGLLEAYASTQDPVDLDAPRFETDGLGPATAVNVSQIATGQQQRAYNIGAEGAVDCVGYWMASAFTGDGKAAWYYQYSVPFAVHGADVSAYYGSPTKNQGPDLVTAFRKIYGNFITADNPSIPAAIANGESAENALADHPARQWPPWSDDKPLMLNLNQTGGVAYATYAVNGAEITQFRDPGLSNDFTFTDAYKWEGGRGKRCEYWRKISPFVPQ
ncbi:hypothetical protein jhhlp_007488 [Lomentospora prolificans]|uniref:Carboxylic ester hydrolase n=1 Tax=Lomentospora prolificans TaxID=41688 RepID=A0A2N3N180_9PEZI|nr:hypothetical protein jhhlp_007488 [Lomentospora prolificans]